MYEQNFKTFRKQTMQIAIIKWLDYQISVIQLKGPKRYGPQCMVMRAADRFKP